MRKDLSLAQQVVQTGHACFEAGSKFHVPETNLILLDLDGGLTHLNILSNFLDNYGIKHHKFYEPDIDQHTSLCTEPVTREVGDLFKNFQLWQGAG